MEVKGIPRHQKENPYKYDEEDLQNKKLAMLTLKQLYPDVPEYYASMVYDLCKNTGEEELEKIKWKVDNVETKHKIPEILEHHGGITVHNEPMLPSPDFPEIQNEGKKEEDEPPSLEEIDA